MWGERVTPAVRNGSKKKGVACKKKKKETDNERGKVFPCQPQKTTLTILRAGGNPRNRLFWVATFETKGRAKGEDQRKPKCGVGFKRIRNVNIDSSAQTGGGWGGTNQQSKNLSKNNSGKSPKGKTIIF